MRSSVSIAVITDVHGNGFGAEQVAADIRRSSPDLVVNLGDQVWGQTHPALALDIQRGLNAIEVRGNNEERLTCSSESLTPEQCRLREWLESQLPAEELRRLAQLPLTASLADGAVLVTHGHPSSCWEGLIFTDGPTGAERSDPELAALVAGHSDAEVIMAGHMHRNGTRTLGQQLLVNISSVSYRPDADPRAGWALLTRCAGRWNVEFRQTPYDTEAARAWMDVHSAHLPVNTRYFSFP